MLSIIIANIKMNLRDIKTMAIMVIMPIALIGMLGSSFSNNTNSSIENISLVYYSEVDSIVTKNYENFLSGISKEDAFKEFRYSKVSSLEEGRKEVEEGRAHGLVVIDEKGKKIDVEMSKRPPFESAIIEILTTSFNDSIASISTIYKEDPTYVEKSLNNFKSSYVELKGIEEEKQISVMDYYGISMITLMIMYGAITGVYTAKELKDSVGKRILIAPISKMKIFTAQLISVVSVTSLQMLILIIFSKYVYKVNFGDNLALTFLILLCEIIMASSLGIALYHMFKNENVGMAVVQILVPILGSISGSYIGLPEDNLMAVIGRYISPIKWTNISLMEYIHLNKFDSIIPNMTLTILISLVLIYISALSYKKREMA